MLADVIESAKKEVRGNYDNSDVANAKRMLRYLKNMMGMQMPAVDAYVDRVLGAILVMILQSTKRMQVIAHLRSTGSGVGQASSRWRRTFWRKRKTGRCLRHRLLSSCFSSRALTAWRVGLPPRIMTRVVRSAKS